MGCGTSVPTQHAAVVQQALSGAELERHVLSALADVQAGRAAHATVVAPLCEQKGKGEQKHEDNHFVFFLKPEATTAPADVRRVLQTCLTECADNGITVHGVRVLGGSYLSEHDIIGQHYGVISAVSKQGTDVLSKEAQGKLEEMNQGGKPVYGAHQFMDKHPEVTPAMLQTLNESLGTTRLAGGTYAMEHTHDGEDIIILNPFHAMQLVPYYDPTHAIVVFECTSTTAWTDLRTKVCGATNPEKARDGSIRKLLFNAQDKLNLPSMSQSSNGCHMSAGPLEAMIELRRFFGVDLSSSLFGQLLVGLGLQGGAEGLEGVAVDANFDNTEELDALPAAKVLLEMK